jgi:hypothetical protein
MSYLSESFEDVFGVPFPYTKSDIDRAMIEQCVVWHKPMGSKENNMHAYWMSKTPEERSKNSAHASSHFTPEKRSEANKKGAVTNRKNGNKFSIRHMAEGVEYNSLSNAARAHNINVKSAYYRVRSENFPGWYKING